MPNRDNEDTRLEEALGAVVLRPDGRGIDLMKALLEVVASLGVLVPAVVAMIKGRAVEGMCPWNVRKVERVRDVLVGLYALLQRTRFEYVEKEEFPDILEEALRRISQQPDPERRRALRSVFEKILEQPLSHCENRLFLQLADELPSGALRLLSVMHDP